MGLENLSNLGEAFFNSMIGVFNFFALVFLLRLIVSLIASARQGMSSVKKQFEEKEQASANSQELSVETESPVCLQEMVYDKICGKEIPKNRSYIVAVDDVYHYFCSWECRQQFVNSLE